MPISFFRRCLLTCAALTIAGTASAEDTKELLNLVRDAHAATRESIRTLHCRIDFKGQLKRGEQGDKEEACAGEFWWTPEAIRGKVFEDGKETDYVWRDSIRDGITVPVGGGATQSGASRSRRPNRAVTRCDLMARALLALNVPGTIEYVPFEELIKKSSGRVRAERRPSEGGVCVVELAFPSTKPTSGDWRVEVQFDPKVNYLVKKVSYRGEFKSGPYLREEEVLAFNETVEGISFPERIASRAGETTDWRFTATTSITGIQINQDLPAGVFRLRYPRGIMLVDSIRGVSYRVNEAGEPISKEQSLPTAPPPPLGDLDRPADVVEQTKEEPRSWTRWVFRCSLSLFIVFGIAILVKRFRRR